MAENEGGVPIEATPTIEISATVEMGGASSESNAEAWAVGERHGVPVSSSDQTYHNNSKYYAEQAGISEDDAEAWATGKKDGTDVPSTDPAYHNNARYYRELSQGEGTGAERRERGGGEPGSSGTERPAGCRACDGGGNGPAGR